MKNIKLSILSILAVLTFNAQASGLVSPPNTPLETGVASAVKPNLMFVLDDSGSMAWDFLGDQIGNKKLCKKAVAGWSSWFQINSYPNNATCLANKPVDTTTSKYQCAGSGNRRLQQSNYDNITNFSEYCSQGGGSLMNDSSNTPDILYFAYQANKIYYNPTITYQAGVTSTGASKGDQTIAAAKTNIYSGSSTTKNLTTINEVYYCTISNPTALELANTTYCKRNGVDTSPGNGVPFDYITQGFPSNGYIYPVTGTSAPFYYEIIPQEFCNYNGVICSSTQGGATVIPFPVRWCKTSAIAIQASVPSGANTCVGNYDPTNYPYPRFGKFKRSNVIAGQLNNYANWYTYYRTRMNAAKTAIGITFSQLDSTKRIGFYGMNSNAFLPVSDFIQTQKDAFFTKLYAENSNSGTNLKLAVSAVGRYYANKTTSGEITTIASDPIQYSCQQNFTLLATDGYWNNGTNGKDFDGNNLGNYDNTNTATDYTLRSDGAYDGALSGASGTLADTALYYYKTPLRSSSLANCTSGSTGQNLCPTTPNVPISSLDLNPNLHVNFYAMSLGINGLMTYVKDYNKGNSVDLENIKSGTSGTCSWTTGVCNWPVPSGDDPAAIDDLWHATLNGRGRYFSAESATDIISGLQDALASLTALTGASSAAATSSPNITATNNFLYYTTYRTVKWDGEIAAKTIDPNTGVLSATTSWSARALLNTKISNTSDTRTISFLRNGSGTSTKIGFDFANMNATEKAYFQNKASTYTQYSGLSGANQTLANDGEKLVNYLRGQNGYEETNVTNPLFRSRDYVLGDIVNSAPVYVGGAKYNWTDAGYSSYVASQASRTPIVYAAANDGFLHAFSATTGNEEWAIAPNQSLNKMFKIADDNYPFSHTFMFDGSLTAIDAQISGNWKTVVIAAMGQAGKGFMALDVTNPADPVALWEFCNDSTICSQSDSEVGLAYGNPIVTKRAYDNKWVVYVTSGYDNSTGKGILYELELETGAVLRKLYTGTGSAGAISSTNQVGLSKINALFDDFGVTNTAKAIYAGDLNGDMWKFDLTSSGSTTGILLGSAKSSTGIAQPITTKVELGKINSSIIVYFGTGSYLNNADQNSTSQQSFYAIKDTNTSLGNIRQNSSVVGQVITGGAITSTSSMNTVDWTTKDGWYFNFNSQSGERMNIDPILVLGNLSIITNVPYSSACTAGGNSWYYQVDYSTGSALQGQSSVIAKKLYGALSVGQSIVLLGNTGIIKNYITDAQGNVTPTAVSANTGISLTKVAKKVSWREFFKM